MIIPTVNRPSLLLRAVRSALTQTLSPLEVIVVQDGDDPHATSLICEMNDDRLRVLRLSPPGRDAGGSARNHGIRHASGDWVALLDDDDEWHSNKLEVQVAVAQASSNPVGVVVTGRVERRTPDGVSTVWPLRRIDARERVAEYLFVRDAPGEGWLPTPTVLVNRSLAREIPFAQGLRQHEDYDWLLRLEAAGAEFTTTEPVVATVHVQESGSASQSARWQDSLAWVDDRRSLLGPTAYSAFCLTEVSRVSRGDRRIGAFVAILRSSLRGRPRLRDLTQFLASWVLPARTHQGLNAARLRMASQLGRLRQK